VNHDVLRRDPPLAHHLVRRLACPSMISIGAVIIYRLCSASIAAACTRIAA
jgi:hypothetical protein